jgi:hypothetical protein
MRLMTIIILVFHFNFSFAQVDLCDNSYVWEFTTNEGERNQTTRLLSNDVEDILSQYPDCKVLQRSRYAKLLEQINNEKEIQSLNNVSTQIKNELRTIQARKVIFGSVNRDFQGNVSLRLSFENLETSQIKSNTIFLINEDYYNFEIRKKKLAVFINSIIDPEGNLLDFVDTDEDEPNTTQDVIEDDQWKLVLKGCIRTGDELSLILKVTSKDRERILKIMGFGRNPGSKIFDDKGNEFRPVRLRIGNNITKTGHSIQQELVSDLPTDVVLTFSDIPEDSNKIILFQINLDNDNRIFKFRNININKR